MWLLKTEPTAYAYDDLERDGRTTWDGVKNPVALRNLREMKRGDRVFVYHTGDQKAVIGRARVTGAAYPDPKAKQPGLWVIAIEAAGRLASPVTLKELKSLPAFADSPLVRQGRLSVVPLTAAQVAAIEQRGRR